MTNAAMYLRSSKDRSDVSISSQRRELTALAKRSNYAIVAEYSDTVESAKDEFRPQFQQLMRDLRDPGRTWTVLLATDTSRISRRTHFAHALRHEAHKRGVEVVYSKMPSDLDPISEVIIYSTLTAMDEVHSLMSREKGLAGMAENVRSGWRAGGRAPFGYQLAAIGTGTMRDGREVTKTRLEPDAHAAQARRYLAARARGETRRAAVAASGIKRATSTLVGMEWNALTYAGATVWNVHNEKLPEGGYRSGIKRRPRSDWIIQRDTHEAFIPWEDAEAMVKRLEQSEIGRAVSAAKTGNSPYLLTGLLETPCGQPWRGHGHTHYRYRPGKDGKSGKGRMIQCQAVDDLVVKQLTEDIGGEDFISAMANAARKRAQNEDNGLADLQERLTQISERISRTMDMADQLEEPAPALRRVDELERERKQLAAAAAQLEQEQETQRTLARVTEADIRQALETAWTELRDAAPKKLKPALRSLIDHVELDPVTLETTIHYRMTEQMWPSMASPRGCDSWPHILVAIAAGKVAA